MSFQKIFQLSTNHWISVTVGLSVGFFFLILIDSAWLRQRGRRYLAMAGMVLPFLSALMIGMSLVTGLERHATSRTTGTVIRVQQKRGADRYTIDKFSKTTLQYTVNGRKFQTSASFQGWRIKRGQHYAVQFVPSRPAQSLVPAAQSPLWQGGLLVCLFLGLDEFVCFEVLKPSRVRTKLNRKPGQRKA